MEEVTGKNEEKNEQLANTSNLLTKIVLPILLLSSLFIASLSGLSTTHSKEASIAQKSPSTSLIASSMSGVELLFEICFSDSRTPLHPR
jgi:hypothetical protein